MTTCEAKAETKDLELKTTNEAEDMPHPHCPSRRIKVKGMAPRTLTMLNGGI